MEIHDELFLGLGPGRPQMSLFVLKEKIFGTPVLRTPVMKYLHHDACLLPKRELKINAMISVDFKHFN